MRQSWAIIGIEKIVTRQGLVFSEGGIKSQAVGETITCNDILFRGTYESSLAFLEVFQQPIEDVTYTKLIRGLLWEPEEEKGD